MAILWQGHLHTDGLSLAYRVFMHFLSGFSRKLIGFPPQTYGHVI